MARADLEKQPGDVAAMFDAIAGRYDLLNDLLSMGQVRLWRRAVARITGARPGERVLDLAAGTGTSSLTFTATGADCVACDFSVGMLQVGHHRELGHDRTPSGRVSFAAGDALRLPLLGGWWAASAAKAADWPVVPPDKGQPSHVGLITQRSRVQIPLPLPGSTRSEARSPETAVGPLGCLLAIR